MLQLLNFDFMVSDHLGLEIILYPAAILLILFLSEPLTLKLQMLCLFKRKLLFPLADFKLIS
jgi:hypothetical protein